jgi:RNA polymerase sigma factor (sigma-70 family)
MSSNQIFASASGTIANVAASVATTAADMVTARRERVITTNTPAAAVRFREHGSVSGNRDRASGVSQLVGGEPDAEQQLIDRARGGDVRAYEDLVRRHQNTAFRTACVLTVSPADAEEAVQDAFVKAWNALGRFRRKAPFRPWLLAIVANEAKTRTRSADRRRAWAARAAEEAQVSGPGVAASAEVAVLARERRALLLETVARLPKCDRTVIELRYLLELSEEETAAVLGCRRGTVKSRLSRALDRLRAEIGDLR